MRWTLPAAAPVCPILLVVLVLAGSAGATTWVLRPDGSGDFPTIQAAIAASEDGDEILLEDGTYTRPGDDFLDFQGLAITIRSQSGNAAACVVDGETLTSVGASFQNGEGASSVLSDLTFSRSSADPVVRTTDASPTIRNVIVRDFPGTAIRTHGGAPSFSDLELCEGFTPTIRCAYGAPVFSGCLLEANTLVHSSGGIHLYNSDVTFEDCTIRDLDSDGSDTACVSSSLSSSTFRRCEFRNNASAGLQIIAHTYGKRVLLEDCVIEGNLSGIRVERGNSRHPVEVTIRRCRIAGNDRRGVDLGSELQVLVEDCTIEDNAVGLHVYRGRSDDTNNSLVVRNSIVRRNHSSGIYSYQPVVRIEGCQILGNGSAPWGHGIYLRDAFSGFVVDCVIAGNAGGGLELRGGSYTVNRCTVASNAGGDSGAGIRLQGSVLAIRDSIVWDNCSGDGSEVSLDTGSLLWLDCVAIDLSRVTGDGEVTVAGELLQQDPLLCAPAPCSEVPTVEGVYSYAFHSPADRLECGPIGALPPGCGVDTGVGSSLESLSWGRIKSRHR